MTKTCTQCSRAMHGSARNPVCLACRSSRICVDCGTPVSYRSTGRCRPCSIAEMTSRPGHAERQAAAMRVFNRAPENAGKRREAALKGVVTKLSKPDGAARMAENGRRYGKQNIELTRSAAARAKAGAAISARKMAPVPVEYRDLYRQLRRPGTSADEALAMVLEQQRADEARRLAAMTPFERQLERVRNGAQVVEKFKPAAVEHAFTLGGVAGEAL